MNRLSGPLLDRIDIQLRVERITSAALRVSADGASLTTTGMTGAGLTTTGLTSAAARTRVIAARAAAAQRLKGTPWALNSHVPGSWLRSSPARPDPVTTSAIDRALERGGITMRGYDRVLRVAWTIADLAGADRPTAAHVGQALYLRRAISR